MPARVQREDFDIGAETTQFGRGAGAVCMFVGLVRDLNEGRPVSAMTLEHYPGADREREPSDRARRRWPRVIDALIVHRYGRLGRATGSCLSPSPRRAGTPPSKPAGLSSIA